MLAHICQGRLTNRRSSAIQRATSADSSSRLEYERNCAIADVVWHLDAPGSGQCRSHRQKKAQHRTMATYSTGPWPPARTPSKGVHLNKSGCCSLMLQKLPGAADTLLCTSMRITKETRDVEVVMQESMPSERELISFHAVKDFLDRQVRARVHAYRSARLRPPSARKHLFCRALHALQAGLHQSFTCRCKTCTRTRASVLTAACPATCSCRTAMSISVSRFQESRCGTQPCGRI